MEGFTFTPQLGLITGSLVGLGVGWVIGFFDSNARTAKKIAAAEANAEIVIKEAEKKIEQASQQVAQTPQSAPDNPGFLRLKSEQGRYTLEMDGALVNSALPPDKKKRLIELLTIIRPYLEGGLPPQVVAPAAPIPTPPVAAAASVISQAPPAIKSTDPVVQQVSSSPATPPVAEIKSIRSLSIVNQIDSILQERMFNTPLAKRGIRLHESTEGGVEVYIGLQKFNTIDDVSDPEVKATIRAAIAEWEKKYTPGM